MEHDMNTSTFKMLKLYQMAIADTIKTRVEQAMYSNIWTLSNREPVVICRKSVTACFKTDRSYWYSRSHSYCIATLLFCSIYNNKSSPAPSEFAMLDCYRETQAMLMFLLKQGIQPEEYQIPLDTQKCYWHPKRQLLK